MRSGHHLWEHHPHVRSGKELTFGERAADVMRNAFGSWMFVFAFLAFMAVWMVVNSILLRDFGHKGFDPYPYILLNLALSMMAGLQGALILIAAKRSDRVAAEQATAHYDETTKLDKLLAENTELTRTIANQTKLLDEIHQHLSALSPEAGTFSPPIKEGT